MTLLTLKHYGGVTFIAKYILGPIFPNSDWTENLHPNFWTFEADWSESFIFRNNYQFNYFTHFPIIFYFLTLTEWCVIVEQCLIWAFHEWEDYKNNFHNVLSHCQIRVLRPLILNPVTSHLSPDENKNIVKVLRICSWWLHIRCFAYWDLLIDSILSSVIVCLS